MEHQIVYQGTQSHVTSHPITALDSRFTRIDVTVYGGLTFELQCTIVSLSSVLVSLKKTPMIQSGIQMLSKDTPEYRPHMSCTIEAGLLNW